MILSLDLRMKTAAFNLLYNTTQSKGFTRQTGRDKNGAQKTRPDRSSLQLSYFVPRAFEVSDRKNICNKNGKITTKKKPEPRRKKDNKGQENNMCDYMYVVGGRDRIQI